MKDESLAVVKTRTWTRIRFYGIVEKNMETATAYCTWGVGGQGWLRVQGSIGYRVFLVPFGTLET